MDFKGDFQIGNGQRCYPLTVLDDHSRYLLGLKACPDELQQTVKTHLTTVFENFGLPDCMLMDNGTQWRSGPNVGHTRLIVWLLHLGIKISHSRPRHPQTLGKDERLHRSLKAELLSRNVLFSLPDYQFAFDGWRDVYNLERPHEALDFNVPDAHYRPSQRPFPQTLPPLLFPSGAAIRKVDVSGRISYQGRRFRAGKAFHRHSVGLLHDSSEDGLVHVYFNNFRIRTLDLKVVK
jgi:hypothetical protein